MSIHPEYARLFAALDERGLRSCCLRDELEGGALLGDLDLLVDDHRVDDVLAVLGREGYRVRATDPSIPLKIALTRWAGGRFVSVDLHRAVVQDGIVFLDAAGVLDRARRREHHAVPDDVDLLIVLTVHDLVGKGRIQDKHLAVLESLAGRVDGDTVRTRLEGRASAEIVAAATARIGELHRDRAAAGEVAARLRTALLRDDPGARGRIRRRNVRRFARRWSLRPRAPMYALLGPDGTGKSTLIANLLETFGSDGGFPAIELYMGPWGHYRLPLDLGEPYVPGWSLTTREWLRAMVAPPDPRPTIGETLRRVLRMAGGGDDRRDPLAAERVRNGSRLFLTLRYLRSRYAVARFFALLAVETAIRLTVAYRARRRGVVVLADRYVDDLMTGLMHGVTPEYRRTRAWFCRLVPRPTRTFLLEADAATILARKADLEPDVLERFAATYDALASARGFERVRTDRPPETVARDVVARVFDELCERLRR